MKHFEDVDTRVPANSLDKGTMTRLASVASPERRVTAGKPASIPYDVELRIAEVISTIAMCMFCVYASQTVLIAAIVIRQYAHLWAQYK